MGYSGVGGRVPRYYCRGAHLNHGTDWCISFGGLRVDQAVTQQVLQTLAGTGVEASLAAWSKLQEQQNEQARALEMALQQARYESQRARKQYDAVDPENRLVAGELERRWNDSLAHVAQIETRFAQCIDGKRAGR